jgi:hypothetical protein
MSSSNVSPKPLSNVPSKPLSNVPPTSSNISPSSGEGSGPPRPKTVYTAKGVPIDMEESMYLVEEEEGDGYILYEGADNSSSVIRHGMVYLENPNSSSSSSAASSGATVAICDKIGLQNYFGECWINTIMTLFFFSDGLREITQPLFLKIKDEELNRKIDIAIEKKIIPKYRRNDYIAGLTAMRNRFINHYVFLNMCNVDSKADEATFNAMMHNKPSKPLLLRTQSETYAKTMGELLQRNEEVFSRGNSPYSKDNAGDAYEYIVFNELMHIFDINFGAELIKSNIVPNKLLLKNIDEVFHSAVGIGIDMDYYTDTSIKEKSGHATGFILCNKEWYYYNTNTRLYNVIPEFIKAMLFAIYNGFPICLKEIDKNVHLFTIYINPIKKIYTPKSIFIEDNWYNYDVIETFLKLYIVTLYEIIDTKDFWGLRMGLPNIINHSRLFASYIDEDIILRDERDIYNVKSILDNLKYKNIFEKFIKICMGLDVTFDQYMEYLTNINNKLNNEEELTTYLDNSSTIKFISNPIDISFIKDILDIEDAPIDPSQVEKFNIIRNPYIISSDKKEVQDRHLSQTRRNDLLFSAIADKDVSKALKLLETDININISDQDDIYPLYYAAEYGLITIVRKLIEKGADINARNGIEGITALRASSKYSDIENKPAIDPGIFIAISIALINAGARPTDQITADRCNKIPAIKKALTNATDIERHSQKKALKGSAQLFEQANQQSLRANLQREHNLARENVSTGTLFSQPNERSRSRTRRSNTRRLKRRKTRRRS